jgi:hypothetical protein
MNEIDLVSVLKKRSTVWYLEVFGQPFCRNPALFNKELMCCEIDLSKWCNNALIEHLSRIETVIGIKPTLVKGNCPHTKFNLESASKSI